MKIEDIQKLYNLAEGFSGDFTMRDIKIKRLVEVVPNDLTIHVYNQFCIPVKYVIINFSIKL
jgi:hypothetical protein